MSSQEPSKTSSNTIIIGSLGVAFVILKLCGVIDWSWWWVTVPFGGGTVLWLVLLVVAFFLGLILEIINEQN